MNLPPEEHKLSFEASGKALDDLTTAAQDHPIPPLDHIHAGADEEKSHSWLASIIPTSIINEYENYYHLGNYVVDRKTGEKTFEQMSVYVRLGMHLLYYGSYQSELLHTSRVLELLKDQSVKIGISYDSPESKQHIQPFIDSFDLMPSMADMEKPDPKSYANFNEFFSRAIKPSARPNAEPDNDLVTGSVADCRMVVYPTIDLATKYWIKGFGFTLEKLVDDAKLAQEFDGGAIAIARLAPQDYHRWHAPVSGTMESLKKIPGAYYTVNPQAINQASTLDVFCENRRDVMVIRQAETNRKIVLIAVGAMLVGSIVWLEGFETPGKQIKRGECMGKFLYGGSTCIVLYRKGEVEFDQDLVWYSGGKQCETQMKCNQRIGITKEPYHSSS